MTSVSVIVPLYNEVDSVPELYSELHEVLESMGCQYELILIDDGSNDGTYDKVVELAGDNPNLRLIQFRRNFGQTAAMAAGFEYASCDVVVTMDGDLQNDARDIPRMIKKLEEGYDLVAGWRKDRKDTFVNRRLPSIIANWLISRSTKVELHDYGCTLKAMRAEIAKGIKLYGEMHRFIPALADELGARIAEIEVNHRERRYGKTSYGISRTIRVILDLITVKFLLGYSKRPIHLFGSVAVVVGAAGSFLFAWLSFQKFVLGVPMGNRPLLSLAIMLMIVGIQFLVFGLLAEVLARTYYESQEKKTYTVRNYVEGGDGQKTVHQLSTKQVK